MADKTLNPRTGSPTPCIGICSTTYGDLVCRGCKRFSHEIVQWNGFSDSQQARVRARLETLRAQSAELYLSIVDSLRLLRACRQFGIEYGVTPNLPDCAFRLLRSLNSTRARDFPQQGQIGFEPGLPGLAELGLASRDPGGSLTGLFRKMDAECYRRSIAHYEYSFRALLDS